jgi:hypothetical protein
MKGRHMISALAALGLATFASQSALCQRIARGPRPQARQRVDQVADSTRPNVRTGSTVAFNQLKITLLATASASSGHTSNATARIRLARGSDTDEVTVSPAQSLNWHGYHVAIVDIRGPDEFRGGVVALALAMVASLPQCIGKHWRDPQSAPWPCYQMPDSAREGGKHPDRAQR